MSQALLDGSSSSSSIYANPLSTTHPDTPHSNGSFGPVLGVLAVILVISGGACVVGRISSRWLKEKAVKKAPNPKQNHGLGPKEWQKPNFSIRDGGDIEFGFEKRSRHPSSKPKNGRPKTKPKPDARFAENV